MLDGRGGKADVAAVLAFGGRGCEQHLLGRHAAHESFVIGAAGTVPDQAGDLGLMHRENHRGGRTGAAERVAYVGNIEDRRAVSAEGLRDLDAEQALRARRIDGLLREACVTVDVVGLGGRGCGYGGDSLRKGATIGDELFAGLFSARVTKTGLLNIHVKCVPDGLSVRSIGAYNFRSSLRLRI